MSFQTDNLLWLKGHTVLTEFVDLRSLRLDRGWTYRKLAQEINTVSPAKISVSCLHGLLTDSKKTPNELTLDGIRKFLKSPRARTTRKPKGRAA